MEIEYGVLSGNLLPNYDDSGNEIDERRSAEKYINFCNKKIREIYPEAKITSHIEHAGGSIPASCELSIYFDEEEEKIRENISDIFAETFEKFEFIVYFE